MLLVVESSQSSVELVLENIPLVDDVWPIEVVESVLSVDFVLSTE